MLIAEEEKIEFQKKIYHNLYKKFKRNSRKYHPSPCPSCKAFAPPKMCPCDMSSYISVRSEGSILNLEVSSGPSCDTHYSIQSTNKSKLRLTLGRVLPSDLLVVDSKVSRKHPVINWNLNSEFCNYYCNCGEFPVTITCSCSRITTTVPYDTRGNNNTSGYNADTALEASGVLLPFASSG
nr:protein phosphatase 2C 70 [Tanacetum cinerariifolium]